MAARTLIRSLAAIAGLMALPVCAHDPGLSAVDVRVTGNRIETTGGEFEVRTVNGELRIRSLAFDKLPRGYRQYVTIHEGSRKTHALLSAESPEIVLQSRPATANFLGLGIEHIFTGYDHLAFLFGLLIVGGSLRAAVKIITSFTVAHSIALALATFEVVTLPGKLVEPLIAASIVYVGIENLFRPNLERRWMLTFGFGLVHGLGFASALREAGGDAILPLLSFNLGVELGQIAIAALVFPVIWRLARTPTFTVRFAPSCSVAVALAGSYWLVERTMF